jgi:hypothetical protein
VRHAAGAFADAADVELARRSRSLYREIASIDLRQDQLIGKQVDFDLMTPVFRAQIDRFAFHNQPHCFDF